MNNHASSVRRGSVLIYSLFCLILLMCFGALAVDLGRLRVAKNELVDTTEFACRAGGLALLNGETLAQVQSAFREVATNSKIDGVTPTLRPGAIKVGVYDTASKTFIETNDVSMANAVRATLDYRFGADGMSLFFAKFMTGNDRTISKTVTMMVTTSIPTGFNINTYTINTPPTTVTTPPTTVTTIASSTNTVTTPKSSSTTSTTNTKASTNSGTSKVLVKSTTKSNTSKTTTTSTKGTSSISKSTGSTSSKSTTTPGTTTTTPGTSTTVTVKTPTTGTGTKVLVTVP